MKKFCLVCLVMLFGAVSGCASPNIQWARDNNIPIVEKNIPDGKWPEIDEFLYPARVVPFTIVVVNISPGHWEKVLEIFRVREQNPRLIFNPFRLTFAEVLDYPCFFFPPNKIYRKGDYPCLEHEIGHVREYLEGVPYHSKFAY